MPNTTTIPPRKTAAAADDATTAGPTTAADDIIAGLRQVVAMKRAGVDPAGPLPSRTYVIPAPSAWSPDRVRGLRARLGVAQPAFAKLLGVSTILAQGWEQGKRTPAPVAARLLDTVDRGPAAWLATIGAELPGPAAAAATANLPTTPAPASATRRPGRGRGKRTGRAAAA